jgi:cysteinyl-tRNA synthetase
VDAAGRGLEKLNNTVRNLRERLKASTHENAQPPFDLAQYKSAFLAAMDDDFNTPQAIAVLFDLSRDVNQMLASNAPVNASSLRQILDLYEELAGRILGLSFGTEAKGDDAEIIDGLMKLILEIRSEIRAQKMYALSDKIRSGLQALGIVVEDKKGETTWRRSS